MTPQTIFFSVFFVVASEITPHFWFAPHARFALTNRIAGTAGARAKEDSARGSETGARLLAHVLIFVGMVVDTCKAHFGPLKLYPGCGDILVSWFGA